MNKFFAKSINCQLALLVAFTFCTSTPTFANSEVFLTNANVNLRTYGSLDADIIETIQNGSEVTVKSFDADGWSKVVINNVSGYIKSEFLGIAEHSDPDGQTHKGDTVELTHWDIAKEVFTTNVVAEVYDIKTGLTYHVKSFSNGRHADVETVSHKDTEIMKQTFNGVWSWDVRPVLVTINGRTMAASINGMPHGGGVISDNGMDGQVCIHFQGSSTHNGNTKFAQLHQQVALEAYDLSN